ncbi:MAG: excinuclease ABC subunit UvrC [Thermoleophilia bacterium]|nr:excinuclease ABC subunit UvrC [Thermoleophilia bacterium]
MTEPTTTERTRHLLASLPDSPGIYVFRDGAGKVLYVGKAKSLRKRVMSYFRKAGPTVDNLRITRMLKRMRDFDFVVTSSETEALLLESNFIKHHRPPFNVMLRDDKSYPYVAITINERFPRVMITRKSHRPGVVYFGPFANAGMVREIIELLGKIYPYRKCRGPEPGRRTGTPCLNYHIGLCLAPCAGKVDEATYRQMIKRVELLLSGKSDGMAEEIQEAMEVAAAGQQYEEAAALRNRLRALEHLLEKQQATATGLDSLDVIGIHTEGDSASVQVLQIRDGSMSDRQSFFLKNTAGEEGADILEQFMIHYYSSPIGLPVEVVVPLQFERADSVSEMLSGLKGSRVEVRPAVRGRRRELQTMAEQNAVLAFEQDRLREEEIKSRPVKALAGLKQELGLKRIPRRIECYDISNTAGEHPVGSMVVFEEGLPVPAHYRKFAIRDVEGPDDFASMAEVLRRRFKRGAVSVTRDEVTRSAGATRTIEQSFPSEDPSFSARPDLIIVDGGAGQVSAAAGALAAAGNKDIPVIGLAKRFEEIYIKGQPRPLRLPGDSPALGLLQRIRDEAHRFAITFHRQKRGRAMTGSILDSLPGIGPARKRAILAHFGSPERFLAASRDELEAVPGLPPKVAREVYAFVHKFGQTPADYI